MTYKNVLLFCIPLIFTGCLFYGEEYVEPYWQDGVYLLHQEDTTIQLYLTHQHNDYDGPYLASLQINFKKKPEDTLLLQATSNANEYEADEHHQTYEKHHFNNEILTLPNGELITIKSAYISSAGVSLEYLEHGITYSPKLTKIRDFEMQDLQSGTYTTELENCLLSIMYKESDGISNIRSIYIQGNSEVTTNVGIDLWKTGLIVQSGDFVAIQYSYNYDEYSKSSATSNPTFFTIDGKTYNTFEIYMSPNGMRLKASPKGHNQPLDVLLTK